MASALDAALVAGDGMVVMLRPGVYIIGSQVDIPAGTTLSGAGMDSTILRRKPTFSTSGSVVTASTDHSRLCDLTVDANIANVVTTAGYVNLFPSSEVELGGTYARVERVKVLSPLHMGVGMLGHDNVLADCVIIGAASGDITRTISTFSAANPTIVTTSTDHGFVDGQYVGISGTSIPALDGLGKYVHVIDATSFSVFSDSGLTTGIDGGAGGVAGSVFTDQGPSRYGIFNANASSYRNTIERCNVTACYWGAVYLGGEQHVCRDNVFWDNHQMSTYTGGGQIALTTPGDGHHRVEGNSISCTASHPAASVNTSGIEITAPYTHVINNTVLGQTNFGIIIQGTDANNSQVVGNQVMDSGSTGIYVSGAAVDFLISGNESSNSPGSTVQDYGIRVSAEASNRYLIVGNRCYLNQTNNILDDGTGTVKQVGPNLDAGVGGMTITGTRASHAETTYTPATNVTAHSTANGRYTKIGRLVFVEFQVQFGAGGAGADARIGLPWSAGADGAGVVGACTETTAQTLRITASTNYMTVMTNADVVKTEAEMANKWLTGCAMYTV
jgi:hypothetical protein